MSKNFLRCLVAAGVSLCVGGALAAVNIVPPNLSGGLAGTIKGHASVSSRGASQYAVPLQVPPGTAGVVPSVSLTYDSDLGLDESGVGWSIGGLSSITRCKRTWTTDGFLHPVDLTAQDAYCIDGQRLIRISGTDGATAEYRTEVESFQRIKSYGSDPATGPSSWTVESPSGMVATYGGSTGNATVVAPNSTVNLLWLLARSKDQHTNYVSYEYMAPSASGEHAVTRIRYTGNEAAPLAPYNAVNFVYENRTDIFSGYTGGAPISRPHRLHAIETRVNTATDGSGGTLVRQWTLGYVYSAASGRSLLQTLTDCDGAGNCLPATTFSWTARDTAHDTYSAPGSGYWGGGQGIAFTNTSTTNTTAMQLRRKALPGDYNGDGRADILYNNEGSSTWNLCLSTGSALSCSTLPGMPAVASDSFMTGDFNADGQADVLIAASNGTSAGWYLCLSTGTGFSCSTFATNVPSRGRNVNNYILGDFDGDGRADMLVIGGSNATTYLCLSTGSGFSPCSTYAAMSALYYESAGDSYVGRVSRMSGNFTNDGRIGFIQYQARASGVSSKYPLYLDQTYVAVWVPGPTGLVRQGQTIALGGIAETGGNGLSIVADVNGDDYSDLVYYGNGYDAANVYHLWSTTCRFTGKVFPCTSVDEKNTPFLAGVKDLNRYDGTDLVSGDAGNGLVKYDLTGVPVSYTAWPAATNPGVTFAGGITADFNGDGLPDSAGYVSSTGQWWISLKGSGSYPDRLKTVTDGYGLVTSYEYRSLTYPGVYTPGSLPTYPVQNAHSTSPVVTKLSVSAASGLSAGATLDTTYAYSGMRSDVLGRGSLGFERITSTESATNVATITTYRQDFPFTGVTARTMKVAGNGFGAVLSDEVATWQTFQTYPGVQARYVRSSTTTGSDLSGDVLPTHRMQVGSPGNPTDGIDGYGNVTYSLETVVDGAETFTTTTVKTVENRTGSNWMLGLATDTAVIKSAPYVSDVTRQVSTSFDAWGAPATSTVQPGAPNLSMTTTYTPDPVYGVVNQVTQAWTDPLTGQAVSRNVATNTYDARRRWPLSVVNALSQSQSSTYDDGTGLPLSTTDSNQLTITRQYDGWGRKVRETLPDATSTTWAYKTCVSTCGWGNTAKAVTIRQQWAAVGGVPEQMVVPLEEFIDARGRSVFTRTWNYAGSEVYTDAIYDARGRLDRTSAPQTASQRSAGTFGWTYRISDDLARPTQLQTTNAANNGVDTTAIAYAGLSTTTTDANGHSRTEVLNGQGKIKRVVDALNNAVTYTYDPFGNLVLTRDPVGNQMSVTYDALGRKVAQVDPDLGSWSYVVDAAGRTRRQTDGKSMTTTMAYDLLDRMTQRLEPDLDSRWSYDAAAHGVGRLAEVYTVVGGTGAKDYRRAYTYDALGREVQETSSLDWDYSSLTTYNSYGQAGSLTHRRNAVGATDATAQVVMSLGYNNQGALSQVQRDGATVWTLYDQDARGNPTLQGLGNGIRIAHGYNLYTGRVETIRSGPDNLNGGLTPSLQFDTYVYDPVGNVLSLQQWANNAGTLMYEAFSYDALNRLRTTQLAGAAQLSIGIDALGNIAAKSGVGTYNYPAAGAPRPHLISSISGTVAGLTNPVYGYDGNGNIVNGLNRAYTWSNANLPVTIDRLTDGTQASANLRYEFLYGPERQRNRQVIRAMSGSTPGALQTVMWTAAGIEKEIDHAGNRTKLRTYLPLGLGYTEEVIAGTAIAPTATGVRAERYFHKDHLGSLNVITDGSGAVLQRMGFDGWGRRRDANGADMPWSVLGSAATANMQDKTGYTGQEQLDDLGLVHLNGRVYDPMTGRMTSADPTIPNPYDLQSLNRASYVNNNPLGFTDPTGFIGEGTGPGPVVERETPQAAKAKNGGEIWGLGTDVTQRAPLGAIGPSTAQSAPQSTASKTDGKTAEKGSEPAGLGLRPKIQGWIDKGVEAGGYSGLAMGLGAAGTAFNEVFVPDSKTEVGLAMLGPLGKVGKLGKVADLLGDAKKIGPGEDLFVGLYGEARRGNLASGLNATHTPHHVVQNAVSETSHSLGATINLRRDLHEQTRSFGRNANLGSNLGNLAADIRDLRSILGNAGYDRTVINTQMRELIQLNRTSGNIR